MTRSASFFKPSQTVAALETFILAMTLYPEVQRKAQAEIDRVVGNSRLPEYSDQDALPYVDAVLKEVLRWHPVTPLGMYLVSMFAKPTKQECTHRSFAPSHEERYLRRLLHSCRFDNNTKCLVNPLPPHMQIVTSTNVSQGNAA